jgi:Cu2+-exporting ATPase
MTQVNVFSSGPSQDFGPKGVAQPHSTPVAESDADARLQLLDTPEEWAAFSFQNKSEPDGWTSSVVFEGMHCAACAITLEDALRSVPGVHSAQISGASHRGQVVWSSELTRPSEWMHAVERYGYKALPANDSHDHARRRDEARRCLLYTSDAADEMD